MMNPEDIKAKFGKAALNRLYDVIFDRPVHEMADWILSFHSEQEIKEWIDQLYKDDLEA